MSIHYRGTEYFLIPFEKLEECIGMEIICYNAGDHKVMDTFVIESISSDVSDSFYIVGIQDIYGGKSLWAHPSFWEKPAHWYLPYAAEKISEVVVRPTYCQCSGPAEDKRCFDTFTVEKCCVRCHNRKRG